jgi:3-dehydroquinate synthetase
LLSGFRISHGEAVANGVLLDSIYAERRGWITKEELGTHHSRPPCQRLPALVRRTGPPTTKRHSGRIRGP